MPDKSSGLSQQFDLLRCQFQLSIDHDRNVTAWARKAPCGLRSPAQKVYILHKKLSLGGALCAKPAWVVNAALPPVLNWENCVVPPALVMTVALPALLNWENCVVPRKFVMTVALPAVLEFVNSVAPKLLAMR